MKKRFSLVGEWIGHYPGHFDEVIRIEQRGDQVEAVKITGDDYVPAGATTWRASLRTLKGEGQIAEEEFTRARFIPGRHVRESLAVPKMANGTPHPGSKMGNKSQGAWGAGPNKLPDDLH